MTPAHHDLVLAITSHVPHLIAYNIVGTVAELEEATRSEVLEILGGRLSRFHAHRRLRPDDVARRLPAQQGRGAGNARALQRRPDRLQRMIRRGDGEGLFDLFTRTRAIRRGIVAQGQETAAPDFGRRARRNARQTVTRGNAPVARPAARKAPRRSMPAISGCSAMAR